MAKKTHIDNWITKAEPDYYTMFIKAWIPFNAWYFTEYQTKKDSTALTEMSTSRNKVRNRIEALLKNTDYESQKFRLHIAKLHVELSNRSILNYEDVVSFSNLLFEDYFPSAQTDNINNIILKAIPNKNTGYRITIVAKDSSKTYMDKNFNPYDLNALLLDNQYIGLPNSKMKAKAKKLFEEINPKKPVTLVSKSKIKTEYIVLDAESKIHFKNDTVLIAKAIIQILYKLRCLLFHGELDPTDTNQSIYEHAFNILNPIIKELR
jgi:hypothetical protein